MTETETLARINAIVDEWIRKEITSELAVSLIAAATDTDEVSA